MVIIDTGGGGANRSWSDPDERQRSTMGVPTRDPGATSGSGNPYKGPDPYNYSSGGYNGGPDRYAEQAYQAGMRAGIGAAIGNLGGLNKAGISGGINPANYPPSQPSRGRSSPWNASRMNIGNWRAAGMPGTWQDYGRPSNYYAQGGGGGGNYGGGGGGGYGGRGGGGGYRPAAPPAPRPQGQGPMGQGPQGRGQMGGGPQGQGRGGPQGVPGNPYQEGSAPWYWWNVMNRNTQPNRQGGSPAGRW